MGSAALFGATSIAGIGLSAAPAVAQIQRHPAVRAGYRFLNAAMDVHYPAYGTLRLPQSYSDEIGLYGTAYLYDAAVAALAYLAEGSPASVERARIIGESLRYAQDHDPAYRDGRLRQSYTVGPYARNGVVQANGFVQPDGLVNAGNVFDHSASYTGDQAWAGLALLALARRGLNPAFLTAAVRLGNWVAATCGTNQALGGYRAGVDRAGTTLTRTDTSHNAVLAAFFGQLATLTGDEIWLDRRTKAAAFVHRMWQADGGFYASGSDDGIVVGRFPVTTASQTSAVLGLAGSPRAANTAALDYVIAELTVTDTAERVNSALPVGVTVTGVTCSDRSRLVDPTVPVEPGLPTPDPDAVWLEGTAQLAAALLERAKPGDLDAATARLNTLAEAQATLGTDEKAGDKPLADGEGLVAATSPLHTGLGDTGYYPYRHVGTTAWYLLAVTGTNPLAIGGPAGWERR
ncbi:Tat pathway signal sequence domain protein [Cryptosporangium phraense]|uniref:Tat pathway signal sequence domain protein n=2 Tax=Cryptosporangium phraense TaxID=2593070 RepID=A0A545AJT6_9ACTN|nr:Tat pathway signal sequence domain protein [Cryptosporangium phraense]